jgi:hypothetical protein
MEEVTTELGFRDLIGRELTEIGQLSNCADVAIVGPFAQPGQMRIIGHALVEFAVEVVGFGHDISPVREVKGTDTESHHGERTMQPERKSAKITGIFERRSTGSRSPPR